VSISQYVYNNTIYQTLPKYYKYSSIIVSRKCQENIIFHFTNCFLKGPPGIPGVRGLRGIKGDMVRTMLDYYYFFF